MLCQQSHVYIINYFLKCLKVHIANDDMAYFLQVYNRHLNQSLFTSIMGILAMAVYMLPLMLLDRVKHFMLQVAEKMLNIILDKACIALGPHHPRSSTLQWPSPSSLEECHMSLPLPFSDSVSIILLDRCNETVPPRVRQRSPIMRRKRAHLNMLEHLSVHTGVQPTSSACTTPRITELLPKSCARISTTSPGQEWIISTGAHHAGVGFPRTTGQYSPIMCD